MNTEEICSHDGLPDTVAPERLLAKKIKDGTATAYEAWCWLHDTMHARGNTVGIKACDIIEQHFLTNGEKP